MIGMEVDIVMRLAILSQHGFTHSQSIDAIIEAEAKSTSHESHEVIIVSLVSWQ